MIEARAPVRQRRWILIAAIILFVLLSLGTIVRFYTDLLWFSEVRLTRAFWTIWGTRLVIGLATGIIAATIIFINLEVARRGGRRGAIRAADPVQNYRMMVQPYIKWGNLLVALLIGLFTGLPAAGAWERVQLWRNAKPFAVSEPLFGRDVGFYVFNVPFQKFLLSVVLGILFVSLLAVAIAHLLNGSIEPQQNGLTVRPIVKVHVSVLLGLIALTKAWGYRLAQFELVYSSRGNVTGASYTDVKVQLPAFKVLVVIAVITALIFFANIRFRGWLLPVAAIGLWAFTSVVIGTLIPAAVQRFSVVPNELVRERPYIKRNIDATRKAFDLDRLTLQEFAADQSLNPGNIEEHRPTIDNVRLWDPQTLSDSFRRLQAIRGYYEFVDVDVDRYTVGGRTRQLMLAPREVNPANLDERARTWPNTHLTYTHGYGIVGTPANSVTSQGQPDFIIHDLPTQGPDELLPDDQERLGVYFGERVSGYAIANTGQEEIDYPEGERNVTSHYAGQGGIRLSNVLRRAAFGYRFVDFNLIISGTLKPDSRLMMYRDVKQRISTAAPFLRLDRDPYIVTTNEGLYWVVDAYTATDRFPYSQEIELARIFPDGHSGEVNYIRNSVKVVVDAYDGSIDFYVTNGLDPIISAYRSIFPGMFKPIDEMPDALRAHIRYPEDLFVMQAWQFRQYHVTDETRMYSREDVWDFPADPTQSTDQIRIGMSPYYMYMRLPGNERPEFVLMLPFTPAGKQNLNGWVAARSDGENYGQLAGFSFPRGRNVPGPEIIAARIEQDAVVSQQFRLWEGARASVQRGNLFVIPMGTSLIYVQPIYLRAAQGSIPELRKVVVVYGDQIGFEDTLDAALAKVLTGQPSTVEPATPSPAGETPPTQPSGDVKSLLDQAAEHFRAADEALRRGDLAAYQREVDAAKRVTDEARQRQAR